MNRLVFGGESRKPEALPFSAGLFRFQPASYGAMTLENNHSMY